MHIIITGNHIDVTIALRKYTLDKMESLKKYVSKDDTSAKLTVELSKTTNHHNNGDIFQAEGMLHIRGKETSVKTTQNDLYKAIDVLKDMLIREVASHKDKERSIVRRSAHRVKALFKKLI